MYLLYLFTHLHRTFLNPHQSGALTYSRYSAVWLLRGWCRVRAMTLIFCMSASLTQLLEQMQQQRQMTRQLYDRIIQLESNFTNSWVLLEEMKHMIKRLGKAHLFTRTIWGYFVHADFSGKH